MYSYQLICKRCGGFLYEEEIFYDQNDEKIMQIGCYICSHKGYTELKNWKKFKNGLLKAIK